jgi:hypothetical protein
MNKKGDIINFYEIIPKKYIIEVSNPNYKYHNIDIPFRMCVVAPSGSGKTNFVLNLITEFSRGKGTFADITIVTKNKDEPLYNYLSDKSENIRILEGLNQTPDLDEYDKDYNHLVIWDDLVLSKNLIAVESYYIRARKLNVSLMFLSQSYVDIPKTIRKNSDYLILFDLGGSNREQNYILKEWGSNLTVVELRALYDDATEKHLNPLIIKGGKCDLNKKYRKGFLTYYNLDSFLKGVNTDYIKKGKKIIKKSDYSDSDSE